MAYEIEENFKPRQKLRRRPAATEIQKIQV